MMRTAHLLTTSKHRATPASCAFAASPRSAAAALARPAAVGGLGYLHVRRRASARRRRERSVGAGKTCSHVGALFPLLLPIQPHALNTLPLSCLSLSLSSPSSRSLLNPALEAPPHPPCTRARRSLCQGRVQYAAHVGRARVGTKLQSVLQRRHAARHDLRARGGATRVRAVGSLADYTCSQAPPQAPNKSHEVRSRRIRQSLARASPPCRHSRCRRRASARGWWPREGRARPAPAWSSCHRAFWGLAAIPRFAGGGHLHISWDPRIPPPCAIKGKARRGLLRRVTRAGSLTRFAPGGVEGGDLYQVVAGSCRPCGRRLGSCLVPLATPHERVHPQRIGVALGGARSTASLGRGVRRSGKGRRTGGIAEGGRARRRRQP